MSAPGARRDAEPAIDPATDRIGWRVHRRPRKCAKLSPHELRLDAVAPNCRMRHASRTSARRRYPGDPNYVADIGYTGFALPRANVEPPTVLLPARWSMDARRPLDQVLAAGWRRAARGAPGRAVARRGREGHAGERSSHGTFEAPEGAPGLAFAFQALQLNYEGNVSTRGAPSMRRRSSATRLGEQRGARSRALPARRHGGAGGGRSGARGSAAGGCARAGAGKRLIARAVSARRYVIADEHESFRHDGYVWAVFGIRPHDQGSVVVGHEAGAGQQAQQLEVIVTGEHFNRPVARLQWLRRGALRNWEAARWRTTMGRHCHARPQSVSTTPATGPSSSFQNSWSILSERRRVRNHHCRCAASDPPDSASLRRARCRSRDRKEVLRRAVDR